jgi:hypothetical protein
MGSCTCLSHLGEVRLLSGPAGSFGDGSRVLLPVLVLAGLGLRWIDVGGAALRRESASRISSLLATDTCLASASV